MSVISVKDLSVGYEATPVAEHISFELDPGDFLCIVGENGSGKSTLIKSLLHLQEPISGQIQTVEALKRSDIGYLPQQTDVQKDFPASVREIVLSGCQAKCGWRPFYNRAEKQLAERNMDRMGIAAFAGRCYRELSGGQQQKVLLARALCAADRMLILDEPVTGLDPKAAQEMYDLIRGLSAEGMTILMVSHDIDSAVQYATHVLHIGDTLFFGTKEAYLKSREGQMFLHRKAGEAL